MNLPETIRPTRTERPTPTGQFSSDSRPRESLEDNLLIRRKAPGSPEPNREGDSHYNDPSVSANLLERRNSNFQRSESQSRQFFVGSIVLQEVQSQRQRKQQNMCVRRSPQPAAGQIIPRRLSDLRLQGVHGGGP